MRKCTDSDYPVDAQSIIQAFAFHSYMLQYPWILLVDNEGHNKIVHLHSLIWALLSMPEDMFLHHGAHISRVPYLH